MKRLMISTQVILYLSCLLLTSISAQSFSNYNDESPCSECRQSSFDDMMGQNFYTAEEELEEKAQRTLELFNRLQKIMKDGFKFTGIKGPTGKSGVRGKTGVNGKSGVFSPQGMRGPQGFPGAPGIDGMIGSTGLPGSLGQIGTPGMQGPVGLYIPVPSNLISKRSDGTNKEDFFPPKNDFQAPKSTQNIPTCMKDESLAGLMHLQKRIILELIKLNQHLDEEITSTKHAIEDLEKTYKSFNMVGPPGVVGDTGPIGDTGPEGWSWYNGDTGPSGQNGRQGNRGPIGPNGATGLPGPPGIQGAMGPPGDPAYSRVNAITTRKPDLLPQYCNSDQGVVKSLIDTLVSEGACP